MECIQGRIEQLERDIQRACIGCEMMTSSYHAHVSWCPALRIENELAELKDGAVADTPLIVEALVNRA